MFPKVPDQHKVGQPLIRNGLGVLYVLFTTVYLFILYFSGYVKNPPNVFAPISAPFTLAACILFGGFMGMLDDWIDLKWRYKAFMPLIAALPLIYFALNNPSTRTSISFPLIGTIQFGAVYFYVIIPLIVMIVTNTVNMLGGLNGLETLCPAIVIVGLMVVSPTAIMLLGPLVFWLILTYYNLKGKIFVGNTGSFAIGITIASFAVISDLKLSLLVMILPYIFNSSLILLTVFFVRKKASMSFKEEKLSSDHRRSLVTLITYRRPLTERQVVAIVAGIVVLFTVIGILVQLT